MVATSRRILAPLQYHHMLSAPAASALQAWGCAQITCMPVIAINVPAIESSGEIPPQRLLLCMLAALHMLLTWAYTEYDGNGSQRPATFLSL